MIKRFRAVSSKVSFPDMEQAILDQWRNAGTFAQVNALRHNAPLFVFYEGPPTANGNPGLHHVLSRVFKDVILRYKTMQGFRPIRKAGWDTHGLPVELEIEKELGLNSKREIEEFGVAEFNRRCKDSVFRYVKEWELMTERAGVWLDMEDAYVTYDNSYIETAWKLFRRFWDQGLIYQGNKVTPHCPRCVTSLSSHEVAQGYRENTPDPSIYVRFPLSGGQNDSNSSGQDLLPRLGYDLNAFSWKQDAPAFLVWTTTPWTLTANMALAVAPQESYALVEHKIDPEKGERLIIATKLFEQVLGNDWTIIDQFTGEELVGLFYSPPYQSDDFVDHIYRVLPAEFVTTDEGTGIVHTAPAYGADDQELGKTYGIPTNHTVDVNGVLQQSFPGNGLFFKEADKPIIGDLELRGLLFRNEVGYHTYPFCWRCDTPLLYYAKSSWYIKTTAVKDDMVRGNQSINWHPQHIQEGRFGEWLRNNVDWAISRERYWGTPIPVWKCQGCDDLYCIGDLKELHEKATDDSRQWLHDLDLHRPHIDKIEFKCQVCGDTMRRVPEVADAWYDSGAMPFAQWTYPVTLPAPGGGEISLRNIDELVDSPYFPADYITEAVDQTRGWFYSLLAVSTLVARRPSYQNVICLGLILDEKGEKMSKSKGNVVNPWDVLNALGADALRWYLFTAAPAGTARRFSSELVQESLRRFLLTLWNTYSFFVTYANLDDFDPQDHAKHWNGTVGGPDISSEPPHELDRWMLSELHQLIQGVSDSLNDYNPTEAGRRIEEFVDGLSNWYIRRSRRRFWKSEADEDKRWAYVTLYTCLLTVSQLIAPLTPFVADEIYSNLAPKDAPKSVHLTTYPRANLGRIDRSLNRAIYLAMRIASLGRAARSKAGVKVRQPLARVLVHLEAVEERKLLDLVKPQILQELNVKGLEMVVEPLTTFRVQPNLKLLGPKYGDKVVQISKALSHEDAAEIARQVKAGDKVIVREFTLEPNEVVVLQEESETFTTAMESGITVGVDTFLTPELETEGLARELIHRLQTLRRSAGLKIEDRIATSIEGGGENIAHVLSKHASYISQETLSQELIQGPPPSGAYSEHHQVADLALTLAVKKLQLPA